MFAYLSTGILQAGNEKIDFFLKLSSSDPYPEGTGDTEFIMAVSCSVVND